METKIDTQAVNRLMMLTINVGNMAETKAFYADKLGLKVKTDYRIDDNNWWVSLAFPDGEATLTLARSGAFPENVKPGTLSLYFETSDVVMAHDELAGKGVRVDNIRDDLFGPGSGVKFFSLKDPDGNLVHVVQKHEAGVPF